MKFNWIFLLLCFFTYFCFAISESSKSKLDIESDSAEFDKKNHINIYVGHVKVTQDDMLITGDRVEVKVDEDNRIIEATVLGKLAKMVKQNLEKGWQAEASLIHYFPRAKQLILIGDAKVSQEKRSLSAEKIEYQIDTQNVKAFSSKHKRASVSIIQ